MLKFIFNITCNNQICGVVYRRFLVAFMKQKFILHALHLIHRFFQSEQVVPDWLEEVAETALGTGYGPKGGRFGGKDTRVSKIIGLSTSCSKFTIKCTWIWKIVDVLGKNVSTQM